MLDIVLDRTSNGQIEHTPLQPPPYQTGLMPQQRLGKPPQRGPRPQSSLANSIRPAMRAMSKPGGSAHLQHRTPITQHRQQMAVPPPPMKQTGQIRNGPHKIHSSGEALARRNGSNRNSLSRYEIATPFNAKQMTKYPPRTPTLMQYAKPFQKDAWNNNPPPSNVAPALPQYANVNLIQPMAYPFPMAPQPMNGR